MTKRLPDRSTAARVRRRTQVLGAGVLLLLAVTAGCSAEGGEDAAGTTTTTASSSTTDAPTTTTDGTTTTADGTTTTTGLDPGGEATMTPAVGWTDVDGSRLPPSVVAAYGAPDTSPGFRDNVNLLVEEGRADDLDDYWERSEDGLASLPDVEEIEPRSDTTMDGHPAYQKVWAARTRGRQLRFWSVVAAVDGDGYVFTYTATPGTFDDHRADAREMFESIDIPG